MSGSALVGVSRSGAPWPSPSWVQRLQHGRGALCRQYARANGDDVHGEGPRPQRGPQRRMGHAPRAQLAIGGLPGVHVHKRRRRLVDRQGKFQVEVARDLGCSGWPIVPRRQRAAVDAERLEPLHFVVLGREPCEGRPLDEVIEREQAAHEHGRRRVLASAVFHVLDAKRPVEGFLRDVHGARAAGEDGPCVLDGELLLDERVDEAADTFSVVARLEVRPALRPRKDAAVQGDQGDPFGLAAGPAEGRQLAGAVLQRRDRDGARRRLGVGSSSSCHQRAIPAQVRDEETHRIHDHQLGINRVQKGELE